MTTLTVTNINTGQSASIDFESQGEAAAAIIGLCMEYDSSQFTIDTKES